MATQVGIINAALVQLGANPIASLDDQSVEATSAGVIWDIARRDLLRLHTWNFAIKRRELAQATETPVYAYDYKYTLPAECVKLLQVYEDDDFKLEGRNILTNKKTCKIKYVFDNKEIAQWDPQFVNVMKARLSYELSYTLPRFRSMIDTMYQIYQETLRVAKSFDAQEDIEDPIAQNMPDLISVRFHGRRS